MNGGGQMLPVRFHRCETACAQNTMASEDLLNFTEELIENVKKNPLLYDMSHPHYKNFRIKNKKWDEIAKSLNIEGMDGK